MITDAELAVAAAQAGADVVRGMYGTPLARFDKSAGDFATAADLEAERAITNRADVRGAEDARNAGC